jgi:hypothetical protein
MADVYVAVALAWEIVHRAVVTAVFGKHVGLGHR